MEQRTSYHALDEADQDRWRAIRATIPFEERRFFEGCLGITGQLWRAERKLMYETILRFRPAVVCEVGTWLGGGSTFFIAQALYENGQGILYTVEIDPDFHTQALQGFKEQAGYLLPHVRFLLGGSSEIYPPLFRDIGTIDAIFLDGGDDPEKALSEYRLFEPWLAPEAVLMAHDWLDRKMLHLRPYIESDRTWRQIARVDPPDSVGFVVYRRSAKAAPADGRRPMYITIDGQVHESEDAAIMLGMRNDAQYLSDDGIVQVARCRWEEAQKYEKITWMIRGRECSDDRNADHEQRFECYRALIPYRPASLCELGCGPFTNSRSILRHVPSITDVTLLDPLINDYLSHPHCAYRGREMNGVPIELVPSSIEDFIPSRRYDAVVLVNVLEHCFDIPAIFERVLMMLADSGAIIFSEALFEDRDIGAVAHSLYDAGHPIRITKGYVHRFLSAHFTPLFDKELHGMYGQPGRIDRYFIGIRNGH